MTSGFKIKITCFIAADRTNPDSIINAGMAVKELETVLAGIELPNGETVAAQDVVIDAPYGDFRRPAPESKTAATPPATAAGGDDSA